MTYRCLCQDCLRVHAFQTEQERNDAHAEKIMCQCGGQLCGCPSCLGAITALETGQNLHMYFHNGVTASGWTAEGGLPIQSGAEGDHG